ncbi:hypothetical protein QA645_05170 [Bradyrhizobium sp. CIAT3101]|uniref:hypothetical protein n=1 Tax=Bradyrhizobium sp. CIAT3101 TaxID=439387 RepID=UPI0024B10F53|nr:hypothetical protein [Bradyrhizobium sp. CIAT3101]WFU82143.1 hypothetical protein QA645_05170 [Bradyrhizobium sp. CIAT3101]
MAVYLVTWDLNKHKANYTQARQNLIDHISRYSHIKDVDLDSVWFIQAASTAEALDADIRRHIDKNDRLIVTRLVSGQHEGWLSKEVWDWINPRI